MSTMSEMFIGKDMWRELKAQKAEETGVPAPPGPEDMNNITIDLKTLNPTSDLVFKTNVVDS